jgi:hypothetical protein
MLYVHACIHTHTHTHAHAHKDEERYLVVGIRGGVVFLELGIAAMQAVEGRLELVGIPLHILIHLQVLGPILRFLAYLGSINLLVPVF